jgi:tellurite resistance protein
MRTRGARVLERGAPVAIRSEKLSRLVIGSPCQASWDGMQGDERRRHCLECDRQVHDLREMTRREIAALVEASRGHLCARITRDPRGRILTQEPGVPAPALSSAHAYRQASPVAAAVITAFLGLGSATAAGPPPAPPAATGTSDPGARPDGAQPQGTAAPGAGLAGLIADEQGTPLPGVEVVTRNDFDGQEHSAVTGEDGRFALDGLAAGTYHVEAQAEGFDIDPQRDLLLQSGEQREVGMQARPASHDMVTAGAIALAQAPLRQVFAASDLVVLATAGLSVAVEPGQDYGEVATELIITMTFKGRAPGRRVRVYHAESGEDRGRLAPGTRLLAFLNPRDGETGRKPVYESADYHFGLKVLPAAELEAYGERLTELARLLRHGEPLPDDVAEWLVATAEEPLTRQEATGELSGALWDLEQFAKSRGTSTDQAAQDLRAVVDRFVAEGGSFEVEPGPRLLAAFLTDAQKERLSEAFRTSPRLTGAEIDLYALVRPWAGDAAVSWLARKFQEAEPATAEFDRQVMGLLAEELDDEELKALLAAADGEDEGGEKELRSRFVQALGAR